MESNEENEYRNKLTVCAQNLADKMAVLDARDRLMKLKRMRQTDLATAVAVVGTCPDMCPELERYFRQETNQVSLFEMDANTGRPDEYRMVKEYRRSGADQEEPLAHELRPTSVLIMTMDYLCTNIMDALDVNTSCGEWYDFVWSRTRSIRKDITQQHLCDQQVVTLTEKCSRFHIHCSATLCEQNVKDFDPKINEENLSNCLQSLKDLYYDLSLRDIYCPNESEFRCYEILLHLNDTAILKDVQNYRQQIRDSKEVKIAIKAFFAYHSNNYIKFFKLLDQCSYLMSCILHRYFTQIRQQAFKIMRKCYTSSNSSVQEYPSQTLINCLGFEDSDELKAFCDHIGFECGQGIIFLIRGPNQNNALKAKRSVRLVESKRIVSVGQVINGSSLPPNPYKTIPVHNSFNSEGKLKTDAFEAIDQKIKTIGSTESSIHLKKSVKSIAQTSSFPSASTFGITTNTSSIRSNPFSFNSFVSDNNSSFIQNSNDFNLKKPLEGKSASNSLISEMPSNDIRHQFSAPYLMICENLAEDIIKEVIDNELRILCGLHIRECLTECQQILELTICDIFSDIFLNTSDQMIKEIAIEIIKNENKLRIEKIKENLSEDIFDDLLLSEIKWISNKILTESIEEYIEKENILIANQLLNNTIEEMVEEIASEVLSNETQIRESVIRLIQEKRAKSLKTKYFFKWKDWYSRKKRLKYLRQSFPAAPKWGPTKCLSNSAVYNLSDLSFNEYFNKSVERELLANNLLNFFIDTVIREIASEVFKFSISSKTQFFEYFQQKRVKRIQNKYFLKWKQFCNKKRQNLKRNNFPAAPKWTTNDSFHSRTKHPFSYLDSDLENEILSKRLRLHQSSQKSPEPSSQSNETSIQCITNSMAHIKPLFEKELSESRELTQRLSQQIIDHQNIHTFSQLEDKSIEIEEQNQKEDEFQVIQVFESEIDKINRLKRLLSEERDYFSLNKFTQYLKDNN